MGKYNIGFSPLTSNVYCGRINKKGDKWLEKENVTEHFDIIALQRYIGYKDETFSIQLESGKKYEISVKEI